MKTAIYPGSFDPVTAGHLNIIRRAANIFDRLIVCVMVNAGKSSPMFSQEERVEMIRRVTAGLPTRGLLRRAAGGLCQAEGKLRDRQGAPGGVRF